MPSLVINTIVGALLALSRCSQASPPTSTHLYRIGTEQGYELNVPSGISRTDQVSDRAATYMAVFFSRFELPPGDVVVVRSPDQSVAYEYTMLGRGGVGKTGGFYSGRIPGAQVIIEYKASSQTTTPSALLQKTSSNNTFGYRVSRYVRGQLDPMRKESVCGSEDKSKPVKCYINATLAPSLPRAYEKAKSVARLFINSSYFCTGWLVGSEGHLFTNNHCIATPAQAAMVDVEFDAESSSCEEECRVSLGCRGKVVATSLQFVVSNDIHDYALLKLPADITTKYSYLQVRKRGPVLGEQIYIPHFPNGFAKRITSVLSDQKPAKIQTIGGTTACGKNQVGYAADTSGGSSGSPLLSADDNAVVALHHCGGCENTAVDMRDIIQDLAAKNVSIKDFFASAAPPTAIPNATRPFNTTDGSASSMNLTLPSVPPPATSISILPTPNPALTQPSGPDSPSVVNSTQIVPPLNATTSPADERTKFCSELKQSDLCKYSLLCGWDPMKGICFPTANLLAQQSQSLASASTGLSAERLEPSTIASATNSQVVAPVEVQDKSTM